MTDTKDSPPTAEATPPSGEPPPAAPANPPQPNPPEDSLLGRLRSADLVPAEATTPEKAAEYLKTTLSDLSARLAEYNEKEVAARRARLEELLEKAITAGAVSPDDRAFWQQAHDQQPEPTERALQNLGERNSILSHVADKRKSSASQSPLQRLPSTQDGPPRAKLGTVPNFCRPDLVEFLKNGSRASDGSF